MVAELGEQIQNDDWAIVSGHQFTGHWQRRLLNHDKFYRYNGDCGGFGIGYDTPASVGGALANSEHGRLSIGIVGDGDFNFGPGALWTAAHHKIPLLLVIHNNRAYHAEVMLVQRMAARRGRGNDQVDIGNVFPDPAPTTRRSPGPTACTPKARSSIRATSLAPRARAGRCAPASRRCST